MPKGRHLKPDFFTDKNVVAVQPLARLLFEGIWCHAHDCGHLDDEPIELKMRILPADNCDVDALLDELAWHGLIVREDGVIYVPSNAKHWRVDKRYETKCDACKHDEDTASEPTPKAPRPKGSRSAHTVTTQGTPRDHAADGDGDGDGETQQTSSVVARDGADAPRPKAERKTRRTFEDFEPNESCRRIATERGINLADEYVKLRDWATANAEKKADWQATFRNWLRNAKAETKRPSNANGFLEDLRAGIYGPEAIG